MNAVENLATMLLEQLGIKDIPDLPSILPRLGLKMKEVDATGFDGILVRAQ